MQTDELRAELTDLANEVPPFAGDVAAVRRRVARRRVAIGSVAAVVVVALIGGTVALTRPADNRIHVAGSGKEVRAAQLSHVDATIVMRSNTTPDDFARVRDSLDANDAVTRYAEPPANALLAFLLLFNEELAMNGICATDGTPRVREPIQGFVVELEQSPVAVEELENAVGNDALVRSSGERGDAEAEVFMHVHASPAQTSAVRDAIARDEDLVMFRYLDHDDAYDEFKNLFPDNPELVENQKPESLPESFRLRLEDGASAKAIEQRYEKLPGVDQVIGAASNPFADQSFDVPLRGLSLADACPETP